MQPEPAWRENARNYWRRTSALMATVLAIWFLAGFAIHLFAPQLNRVTVFGFPLGYYMAAQGAMIIFVALVFWYANRQNAIDEQHGVAEE